MYLGCSGRGVQESSRHGFETDSGADPKSLARKTVCLFTLETPGDDTYTVWHGTRVRGSRVQEKGKLVQHKLLLRSFFTHTLAWLVSQKTDPGWIYRHAQKSLIRKRSQETHRLWLADYRGTDTDGTMIQRRITQVHLQSAGISRRCDGEHRCVG